MRVAKDDVGKTVTLGFLTAGRRQQTRANLDACAKSYLVRTKEHRLSRAARFSREARSRTNGRRLEGRDERI